MDDSTERALKMLEEFARMPRETGPVTLSREYLDHIARVEALAANQSGADKTRRHASQVNFLHHYRRVQRP